MIGRSMPQNLPCPAQPASRVRKGEGSASSATAEVLSVSVNNPVLDGSAIHVGKRWPLGTGSQAASMTVPPRRHVQQHSKSSSQDVGRLLLKDHRCMERH